jgi:hypothetical protein
MGAALMLQELQMAGFNISAAGGGAIRVVPAGVLTETQRQAIRANRDELLALLTGNCEPAPAWLPASEPQLLSYPPSLGQPAFQSRKDRFIRWGYGCAAAEALAQKLTRRDLDFDDLHMCIECRHLEDSGRCAQARNRKLWRADPKLEPVRDLLQRCECFQPTQSVAMDGE